MSYVCVQYIRKPKKRKKRSNKPKPSILKSKNQVTLFVNYSYNGLCFPKVYKANRKLCPKLWNFIWGVIYEHTINSCPCYVNNLPMVNNQLHWCLLLNFLVKSHSKLSIIPSWGKCIATSNDSQSSLLTTTNKLKWSRNFCTRYEIHWFQSEASKVT